MRSAVVRRKTRPIFKTPPGEPPAIVSISPSSGTTAGGTTLTIVLDSYAGSYGVTGVTVGGVAANDVTIVNGTTITAVTGARAAGLVPVFVTNRWGRDRRYNAYTYLALGDSLLQENGDDILLETGDRLLKE